MARETVPRVRKATAKSAKDAKNAKRRGTVIF